jgi:hypothetical protein
MAPSDRPYDRDETMPSAKPRIGIRDNPQRCAHGIGRIGDVMGPTVTHSPVVSKPFGSSTVARDGSADRIECKRMTDWVESFSAALARDLIDAADFRA